MPSVIVPSQPSVPYGHSSDFSCYINEVEYPAFVYLNIKKRVCQLEDFEIRIMDVVSTDTNIQYGNTIKIFAESKLILKGRIDNVKFQTDGICVIKGFGMGIMLANKEYTLRTVFNDTTVNIVNYFLSLNNDSASPFILNKGTIEDFGEAINFRSEFDNKLQAMNALSGQLEWDWWVDNGEYPYNIDSFNFAEWRGSIPPVYTVTLSGNDQNAIISDRNDNLYTLINSVIYLGKGEGTNQIWTEFSLVSTIYDKLDQTLTAYTPFVLITANGFPNLGIAKIGRTPIAWTNKIGNLFNVFMQDTELSTLNIDHYKGTLAILTYDATGLANTTLTQQLTTSDTTVTVTDTSSFTATGSIIIGEEAISYTGKTATTFTGCTRGYNSTPIVGHDWGMILFQYDSTKHYTKNTPQAGTIMADSRIGIKQKNISDPTKDTEKQIEMEATLYLLRNATITYEITFEMMDYFDFLTNVNLGDNLQIIDSDSGLNDIYRFLGLELTYDMGSVNMIISASNKKFTESTFIDKMADTERKIQTRLTYSQS